MTRVIENIITDFESDYGFELDSNADINTDCGCGVCVEEVKATLTKWFETNSNGGLN